VLAGLDGEEGIRPVEVVRCRDVHDVDVRVGDERGRRTECSFDRVGGGEGVRRLLGA
jgi:hypothetical protein